MPGSSDRRRRRSWSGSDSDASRRGRRSRGKKSSRRRRRSSSSSSGSSSDSSRSRSRSPVRRRDSRRSSDRRRRSSRRSRSRSRSRSNDRRRGRDDRRRDGDANGGAAAPVDDGKKKMSVEELFSAGGRTGGTYIPPFKLKRMMDAANMGKDKSSKAYQRMTWTALRKSINGLINKVNVTNMPHILPELFSENLVRGRGLFVRSVMKAQLASPGFTHIYAALVAVVNTKLPEIGELLLKRVIVQFRRAYKRNNKIVAVGLAKFIAHLINYQVAHEILALQLLTLLLEKPTDDSVEVASNFVKECGALLAELTPQGLHAIFERFRAILHEGDIDKRVQYTIEALFAVRKSKFADHPTIHPDLDLVESDDQITHELGLDDELDKEELLDVFRFDPEYEKNEALWSQFKASILGAEDSSSGSDGDDESGSGSDDSDDSDSDDENNGQRAGQVVMQQPIEDKTAVDVVNLRRTIYLTIMSSLDFEECVHKIRKLNIPEGSESEVCTMLLECCSQERTYLRYYGLLGQRFCEISSVYQDKFDDAFAHQYSIIHRLETNKLRNVAKFFAHLLFTDALPWTVFQYIQMSEEETTSSSRIFIKIVLLELSDHMGLVTLRERFNDPYMAETFRGMFPRDNPRNTRFAINFFSAIGLGPLTDELREHLKNAPKMIMAQQTAISDDDSSGSDSDSSSSSSGSSGSSSSGSGSSGSSSSGSSGSDSSGSDSSDSSGSDSDSD